MIDTNLQAQPTLPKPYGYFEAPRRSPGLRHTIEVMVAKGSDEHHFLNRHFVASVKAIQAAVLAIFEALRYTASSVLHLTVGVVCLDFKQGFSDCSQDLRGAIRSLKMVVILIPTAVVGVFYSGIFANFKFDSSTPAAPTAPTNPENPGAPVDNSAEMLSLKTDLAAKSEELKSLTENLAKAEKDTSNLEAALERNKSKLEGSEKKVATLRKALAERKAAEGANANSTINTNAAPTQSSPDSATTAQLAELEVELAME